MQGNNAHGTLRYRCVTSQSRALPAYLSQHPKAVYVREDAIVCALDAWLPTLADPVWLASTQEPDPSIEARHTNLHARLAEIAKATGNLVTAIEAGTDPAVINPRLADLRAERESVTRRIASLESQDRLSPADIDLLLAELGGLSSVLGEATPPEKASIYHGLGLHLVYHPADNAVVATADLARVLSRVGGGT